jgi:hypothetical protein
MTLQRRIMERAKGRAFAALCWSLVRAEASDSDVQDIERTARSADTDAARIEAALSNSLPA